MKLSKSLSYPIFILTLMIICSSELSYSQSSTIDYKVTYLASEGFIIESGDKKIAIDALPARRFLHRQGVEKSIIDSIENARSPFDSIDIVFVTHAHLDHFDPDLSIEFLEHDTNAILVCPQQAYKIIQSLGGCFRVEDRIFPVEYNKLSPKSLKLKNIAINAYPLPHGPYWVTDTAGNKIDRHASKHNFGYLIDLNGVKILHTGDNHLTTMEEYKAYQFQNEDIDIAFVEALLWKNKDFYARKNIVYDLIQPKNLVLIHLKIGDDLSRFPDEVLNEYPGLIHFTTPLEIKEFTKKD